MPSFRATVRGLVDEAPGAVTLLLEPDPPLDYRAGQFVSIDPLSVAPLRPLAAELSAAKGRPERPRAYSLASIPSDRLLALGVKLEPSGAYPALLSPHLVGALRVGDVFDCSGPNGFYVLPAQLPAGAHVVHLCGGSGIVPNLGLLRQLLADGAPVRQTLLYANRTYADAMYRETLASLAEAHRDRLEVFHVLSREERPGHRHGRIDEALLRASVPDLDAAWFYVCGPAVSAHEQRAARLAGTPPPAPRFLESMQAMLKSLGIRRERTFTEGW